MVKAEVISIGTELILGEILDTNTQYLAEQLASLGVDLYFISSVGDNYDRLLGVLKQAWDRSDLIITTGGLGPTQDDITREAIAGFLGERPEVDAALKESLVSFFAGVGLEMPPSNIKQATLIPSAAPILNPQGTAPGWWVEKDGRTIVAMPGPPGEMQFMWQNEVLPRLQQRADAIILSRNIKTFGLSEAKVDELAAHLMSSANPTLATYAKPDGIYLRITAKAAQPETAREMISKLETSVRVILDEYIWGIDNDTQENVTGQMLVDKGLSLAVAELFTSGFLIHMLANAPRSRDYFKGGLIATSDEAKVALGLDPHLVAGHDSAEIAAAMASLVRRKFQASIGISVEGYTEPASGAIDKVFIAIDSEKASKTQTFSSRHRQTGRRAAYYALSELRRFLKSA